MGEIKFLTEEEEVACEIEDDPYIQCQITYLRLYIEQSWVRVGGEGG